MVAAPALMGEGEARKVPEEDRDRLGELAARMAHEVKTPLAVIQGYARTVLEADLSEDERRWFLEAIADQAERLARILDRLARDEAVPPG
jgi:signal transduction histidine kinase